MYRTKKILSSVLIALLVVCFVLSVVGIGYYTDGFTNFVKDSAAPMETIPASVASDALIVEIDEAHNQQVIQSGEGIIIQNVKLASSPQNAEGDNYVSQTLVATVYPETVVNKDVLWGVSWGENPKEESVTDYVYLEELSENNRVNVVCKQGFGDSTIIVSCRLAAYEATCVCVYKGEPTMLYAYYNGENTSLQTIDLPHGKYYFDLELYNPLGSVGVDYQNPNFVIDSITMHGCWSIGWDIFNDGFEQPVSADDLRTFTFDGFDDSCTVENLHYNPMSAIGFDLVYDCSDVDDPYLTITSSDFFNASIDDDRLCLEVINDPVSWTRTCNFTNEIGNAGGYQYLSFSSWKTQGHQTVAQEYLSCTVMIRDTVSGKICNVTFIPTPGVESVSLSKSEIVF